MATASDFAFIIGDDEEEISARTAQGGQGDENRRFNFNLDHPIAEDGGVLTFMVRALSNADYLEPRIIMNDHIGAIAHVQRSVGANNTTWFTQVVRIDKGVLRNGDNRVHFFLATANTVAGGPDSYFLRGAVCQYRKTV
ncbi:MAG: hypothetical protein RL685_1594 [Pseudomonadota bacterium]|jgi:hypothetical protein